MKTERVEVSENSLELIKSIDQRYTETVDMFRTAAALAEEKTVVRDIYVMFKNCLKRMHRIYPHWKTMQHGVFGYDDDGMGGLRVVVGTDVTFLLTQEEGMRHLFTVETTCPDEYQTQPTLDNPVDRFFDLIEAAGPDFMDDILIASNFLGHAESIGYKTKSVHSSTNAEGDKIIGMVMVKGERGIRLEFNASTSIKDISQLISYRSKRSID